MWLANFLYSLVICLYWLLASLSLCLDSWSYGGHLQQGVSNLYHAAMFILGICYVCDNRAATWLRRHPQEEVARHLQDQGCYRDSEVYSSQWSGIGCHGCHHRPEKIWATSWSSCPQEWNPHTLHYANGLSQDQCSGIPSSSTFQLWTKIRFSFADVCCVWRALPPRLWQEFQKWSIGISIPLGKARWLCHSGLWVCAQEDRETTQSKDCIRTRFWPHQKEWP